jgi:hypothetical protein
MPTIDKNDPNTWNPKAKKATDIPRFNYAQCQNGCNCREIAEVKSSKHVSEWPCLNRRGRMYGTVIVDLTEEE